MTLSENMLFCHGLKNDSDICIHCLQVFNMNIEHTYTTVLWPFFWDYPGELVPEKNLLLDFLVQGKITEADTPTIRTNQRPTSINPPFLCRMPLLPEPSHFISAWDRH